MINEEDIPPDVLRVGLASEAVKQAKFKRWAEEMRRHGWDARQPTPRMVRALAVQDARKRLEKAAAAAGKENPR